MLHRAASNAYSWWWASHIRTKQSKWLEENLQDMEEKVTGMLQIIENSGESFAQRAEMYYRKRPELISHVENAYRAYRALAERYDHLSKDLQGANRTIATVFPEQFQHLMDDWEGEDKPTSTVDIRNVYEESKANIPKVPSLPNKSFRSQTMVPARKKQLNRTATYSKPVAHPSSGLTKEQAQEEIDKIQKEILALQTEKEFVQSVYERCYAKSWGIENQINDMQAKVSSLQDEFGIGNVIDDNEARALMATTALKSCQETLVELEQKQEKSEEEAEVENQRIKEVHQKFRTLKGEFLSGETGQEAAADEEETEVESTNQQDMDAMRENINNNLEADLKSSVTVMQLADKIDELVEKVVNLETEVSSQSALVNRLRSETDGLQEKIKTLEEEKETLIKNSEMTSNRLKEVEEELARLKNLNKNIKNQNNSLRTHFTEASCNVNHLSVKLQTVKPDEKAEDAAGVIQALEAPSANKKDSAVEEHAEREDTDTNATETEDEEKDGDVSDRPEKNGRHNKKDDRAYFSESDSEAGRDEDEDQSQIYATSLEDREKLLLDEYKMILQNYKVVKKKLGDVEKKNRDGFFELTLQIRELKNALATRDEEIQSLRKISSLKTSQDDHGINSQPSQSPESMTQAASFADNPSPLSSPLQPVFDSEHEHPLSCRGRTLSPTPGSSKKQLTRDVIKAKSDSPRPVSAIEEKIRSEIDKLLEENLEFWLRFSTSVHQIQKFQTSVHDLKLELSKLRDKWQKQGSGRIQPPPTTEARSIYKHIREVQTELTLWMEHNSVLKDEVQTRYTALSNIQEMISRTGRANSIAEETEISEYQAAKFQGEILNMKQENTKVAEELRSGLERVRVLEDDVKRVLKSMDGEFGISVSQPSSSICRARIPLRSFLFGVKLKRNKQLKASVLSCVNPAMLKY